MNSAIKILSLGIKIKTLVSALAQTISVKYFSVWLGVGSPPVALCRLVLIKDVLEGSDVLVPRQGVPSRDYKR